MAFTHRKFRMLLLALLLASPLGLGALQTHPLPGTWSDALTVVPLPDGSLLVAQKSGLVDRLAASESVFATPLRWADLGAPEGSELLGLAVAPDFASSGHLFAVLKNVGRATVSLTLWRAAGEQVVLDRVLVDDLPSGPSREGGVLKFGPDGKLWLGIGDGAAEAVEVKPEVGRGVLLRYNEDGSIPGDNPDPKSAVWAWGLRDPRGLAWQPETGRLYALDRGPEIPRGTMDEVDLMEKGANYGWPKHLGREVVKGVSKPVIYCSSGHSWVPGGAAFAAEGPWKGSLLFAGAGEGVLYRLSLNTKDPKGILFYEELVNGDLGPLTDVVRATDGQLYLLSNEKLYRLVP